MQLRGRRPWRRRLCDAISTQTFGKRHAISVPPGARLRRHCDVLSDIIPRRAPRVDPRAPVDCDESDAQHAGSWTGRPCLRRQRFFTSGSAGLQGVTFFSETTKLVFLFISIPYSLLFLILPPRKSTPAPVGTTKYIPPQATARRRGASTLWTRPSRICAHSLRAWSCTCGAPAAADCATLFRPEPRTNDR